MKIIIHIGWHKTGTTAIQSFLKKNSLKLIDENKLYYPSEGLVNSAHHAIAWNLQGKDKTTFDNISFSDENNLIQQAIESAKKYSCQNLIFSSEEFCTFSDIEIIKLYEIVKSFANKIVIVAYIRRQDLLIESAYNMEVKWWGSRMTKSFQQYVKEKTPFIHYDSVLDAWANVFALENIRVRLYDSDEMPQGDVRLDFSLAAGIYPGNLNFEDRRVNSSLGPKGLAILRRLNRLYIPRRLRGKIVRIILKFEKSSKCVLFNPQQRIEFMENLNASNRRLEKFSINPDLLTLKNDNVLNKNKTNSY